MNLQKIRSTSVDEFLKSSLSSHQNLDIEVDHSQIGGSGIFGFCNQLAQCDKLSFLQLMLCENQLSNEDVENLGFVLGKFTNLKDLSIYLQGNQIDQQGTQQLGLAISKLHNLKTLNLNLIENKIQGFSDLCVGLANCIKLSYLELSPRQNNTLLIKRMVMKFKRLVFFNSF
ncbi:hypothetical protein ABPG73_000904 [Tetrahymena malaccensis]